MKTVTLSSMKGFTMAAMLIFSTAAMAQPPAGTKPTKAAPLAKAKPVSKATPVAKAKPVAKSKSAVPSARPLSVGVDLVSKTRISGTLVDVSMLEMQTSFGSASIPLSEVAGVKFASADDATTTVVMLNGDSITGATDVKALTVKTEWGTAEINGQNIASIMFVPGLNWNPQKGLNGQRWMLISTPKPSAKPAATRATPRPATSTNRSTSTRSNVAPSYNSNGQPIYRNN